MNDRYIASPAPRFNRIDTRRPSTDDCANLIVDRDPCICGTRKDLHDQFGCKTYRRAA